jgi:hypothetical protein
MNERIQQLAIDCAGQKEWDFPKPPASFTFNREELAKFAELIVAECLNQCYNRGMNDELYAGQLKAAEYIEEHFGIVE